MECCPTDKGLSSGEHGGLCGQFSQVADVPVYTTGASLRVVLCVVDIFGFSALSSLRFADELARESGVKVVMMDHFRGKPLREFPPKEGGGQFPLVKWLQETVPPSLVRSDVIKVLDHVTADNNSVRCGLLGFCWGGKMALMQDDARVRCIASPHPSMLSVEDCDQASSRVPLMLLPSKGEDAELYRKIAQTIEGRRGCSVHRFDTAEHGFCAARADFVKDAENISRAKKLLGEFFNQNL